MRIERLDAEALGAAFRAGCRCLELNRQLLDRLNVFPVPDGDTGVNMVSTFKPAVEDLTRARCASLGETSAVMRSALERSCRGNSGFILAQFFRGFWEAAGARDALDPEMLASAFQRGSFAVVRSLLSPVEGTMLSVIASMAEAMGRPGSGDILGRLEAAIEAGGRSLDGTPEQNPILADAGVVDAGGLGFLCIVKGMRCGLIDEEVVAEEESRFRREPVSRAAADRSRGMEFRWCTELEVEVDPTAIQSLRDLLPRFGGSIALLADGGHVRVHIHTNDPDALVEGLGRHGKVSRLRCDDMAAQVAGTNAVRLPVAGRGGGVSVLSIVPGPGFRPLFEELGASACLEYLDSLPSAEEIRDAIGRMAGEDVIVLANNPDIMPAVRLAGERAGVRVHVLRTRGVVEGMTALYGYSESDPAAANVANMTGCIGLARAFTVYRASRGTSYGGLRIREGDWFVADGGEVLSTGDSPEDAVVAAVRGTDIADRSHASLFTGEGFDATLLGAVRRRLAELNPLLEFEEHYGGQRKALLIVALE
jgi:DAK2 domain fusion protein YloV